MTIDSGFALMAGEIDDATFFRENPGQTYRVRASKRLEFRGALKRAGIRHLPSSAQAQPIAVVVSRAAGKFVTRHFLPAHPDSFNGANKSATLGQFSPADWWQFAERVAAADTGVVSVGFHLDFVLSRRFEVLRPLVARGALPGVSYQGARS